MSKNVETITFEHYFESILSYIAVCQPTVRETLEFIGALIYEVLQKIEMSEIERKFYRDVYNKIITKKLMEKKEKFKEDLLMV